MFRWQHITGTGILATLFLSPGFYLRKYGSQITVQNTWNNLENHSRSIYVLCCLCSEPSPESENLEQSGETVPLSNQTVPECVRLHRTTLPAQVTSLLLLLWCQSALWEGLQDYIIRCMCVSGRRLMGSSMFDIRF